MRLLLPSAMEFLQVLGRFAVRFGCIAILSAIYPGPQGEWQTFSYLSFLTATCCVFLAAAIREPMLDRRMTNWDEAAAYSTIGLIARAVSLD
ncbi:hypothetical protein HMPREF9946_02484 [Acetobacteraceae bacterium AT-5844]|nr:hypothetical protein HMPREF9946_02484 [Acetobacteraceae bacterium AT-5844]